MGRISSLMENPRCPHCEGKDVRRSPRRGFFELILLSSIGVRPFRCQGCAARFYGLKLNSRVSSSRTRSTDAEATLSVLVYGHEKNKEPFQEKANVRLESMHSAELNLTAKVRPGEKLVLLDPASEEEQRCQVVSVTERSGGRTIVRVRFRQPVWEFWSASKFSGGK
jgi:hypothetical protein